MVGLVRFELTTSCTPCKRATRLRYSPNKEGSQSDTPAHEASVFSARNERAVFTPGPAPQPLAEEQFGARPLEPAAVGDVVGQRGPEVLGRLVVVGGGQGPPAGGEREPPGAPGAGGPLVEQRERETMQDFTVRIEKAAIFRSLENLLTFPFVRARVERGEMELHGAYFGVGEGSLFVLDQTAKEFRGVSEMVGE